MCFSLIFFLNFCRGGNEQGWVEDAEIRGDRAQGTWNERLAVFG